MENEIIKSLVIKNSYINGLRKIMTLRIIFESSDFCVLFLTVMEHECNIVEFSMYCDKLVLSKPLEAILLNIEKSQTLININETFVKCVRFC